MFERQWKGIVESILMPMNDGRVGTRWVMATKREREKKEMWNVE